MKPRNQNRDNYLSLTRKLNEEIIVDGPCRIRVTRIRGSGSVKLCFMCPATTNVLRAEMLPEEQKHIPAADLGKYIKLFRSCSKPMVVSDLPDTPPDM